MRHNNHPKGEQLPQAKLTADIVRQMRIDYAAAHEDGDARRDAVLALMTDEEREMAREARNGKSRD